MSALQHLRGGGRGWALLVVSLGWLAALGTRLAVPAVLPQVREAFGISNTVAGAAITILWLGYAVTQFPAGLLIDRIGERKLLLAGSGLGLVGVVLFVGAPVFGLFLVASVLFGLATGMFGPTRATLVAAIYPENNRQALGVVLAAGSLGAAILPVIAGSIAGRFGWRLGLATVLPLFAVTFVGVWRSVSPRSVGGSDGADPPREALSKVLDAVRHPQILLVGGATVLTVFTYQGFTAFFPTYLISVRNLSPTVATSLFGLFFGVSAVMQPAAGTLADRYGDRPVMVVLSATHVAGLFALPHVHSVAGLALIVVLLGLRGGLGTVNNAYLVAAFPDDIEGGGYGLVRTVYMSLGALGSIVVGFLFDVDLYDGAFVFLAGVLAVGVVLYAKLPPEP